jgi:hypothetical protein
LVVKGEGSHLDRVHWLGILSLRTCPEID